MLRSKFVIFADSQMECKLCPKTIDYLALTKKIALVLFRVRSLGSHILIAVFVSLFKNSLLGLPSAVSHS